MTHPTKPVLVTALALVLVTPASAETIIVQTPFGSARIDVPGKRVDVPNITMDTPAGPFRVMRVPGYAAPAPDPVPPQQQRYRPGESKRLEDLRQQVEGSDPDTRACVDRQVTDQSTADEIANALRECHVESTKKN